MMTISEPLRDFAKNLPQGWELKSFEEMLSEPVRNGIYKSKEFHGRGARVVNMGELFGFDFISNQEMKRVELTPDDERKAKLIDGDLLFARRSLVLEGAGKCSLVVRPTETMTFESSIIRARPNRFVAEPQFLYYLFASPLGRAIMASIATRTAVSGIRGSDLSKVGLPLPPLPIQRRIAGILSAYDELIENSQRRIKILESMARALYREWFVHFRFPGHESVPRVPSQLGEIPQGWEVMALADVCSRITDGSHSSPKSVEDGYPMASVKDMHDWGINIEGCRRIASDDYEELVRNDCKPLRNDVLIAKDGSYLKHTFVVGEEQDLVILSSIAMLRPNEVIHPNYLCFALQDPATKGRMRGIVSGVAIPRIVLKDFRKFHILVPSNAAQYEWAQIVNPLVESCRKLVAQSENLRRTRDLLLPRLLSGQIDVEAIS